MENLCRLTESEKELLNVLGRHPEVPLQQLLTYTTYRGITTVMKKLERFKKQMIFDGPVYDLNYSKLSKTTLHKIFCIIESDQSYDVMMSYVKLIEPIRSIFPVLSPHKNVIVVTFYSSDDAETNALLQMLKDNNIITDFVSRVWTSKRLAENANFFGDPIPSLDNLLDPCDLPDMSLERYDTEWDACDISIIPYLRFNDTKLIEILREEKKLDRIWTYEEVRCSREKILEHGLIRKGYAIFPYPIRKCVDFYFFFRTDDIGVTQRILCNFARGERVYKEYVLCEEWGWILCTCHPLFLTDLLYKLDQIDQIKEKEVYQIRAMPPKNYSFDQPIVLTYYDVETQTLKYPYRVYRERIKETLENEQVVCLE
jgi:hypothetical protein